MPAGVDAVTFEIIRHKLYQVIDEVGRRVDLDGVDSFTVTVAAPDVVDAPSSSVAMAVSVYVPAGTLFHVAA